MDLNIFQTFIKHRDQTGAITKSSKYLASEMCYFLRNSRKKSKRILEVGSGTGAITFEILKYLKEEDHLYIVELNKELYDYLKKELPNKNNITLLNIDILNLEENDFDFIISSLPFNSIPNNINKKIVSKYKSISNNETVFSYFEYKLINHVKKNFRRIRKTFKNKVIKKETVYKNIPPANCYHLKLLK
tara:strand:+ start:16994 stop:17560 length:567 start_codon:yes stop_codon:yes gene_type:complete